MREAERGADGRSLVGVSRCRHEIAFPVFPSLCEMAIF
jgi:hypothetical protein